MSLVVNINYLEVHMVKRLIVPIILLLALTACQSAAAGNTATATSLRPTQTPLPVTQPVATAIPPTDTALPPTGTPTPTSQPEATPTLIRVDLSPAERAAIAQLSQDKGIPIDQIQLVSTSATQWENGCLGIVIPGVLCTKGPVAGFTIILSASGTTYEYHTNQDGTSVLLATSPFEHIALSMPDGSVQIAQIEILASRTITPTAQGFNPRGGSIAGTVYALNQDYSSAVAVDANGTRKLDFIAKPTYGLAVWPGDANTSPRLAWGTQLDASTNETSLMISAPDGSQLEVLHKENVKSATAPAFQLVAQRWSADGKSLYYSKEPVGIGGYIPYDGASSLYRIDIATEQITEIIPFEPKGIGVTCLDAFSLDYSMVANHCSPGVITVRNLITDQVKTIQPPTALTNFRLLGNTRFSPDGSKVAFALAKGTPDAEQSWVAVSDGLSGGSQLVLTGDPGAYYNVLGWLNDNTLLVQITSFSNPSSVWTVNIDGNGLTKVSDGTFLTFVDQYRP